MRFSENGLYIEKYIKCANCGLLVFGRGNAGIARGKKRHLLLRLVRAMVDPQGGG